MKKLFSLFLVVAFILTMSSMAMAERKTGPLPWDGAMSTKPIRLK